MTQYTGDQPTHFELRRSGTGPEAVRRAGRAMLVRVVTVAPAPELDDDLMREFSMHSGVNIGNLPKTDVDAAYEFRSDGQSVTSWRRIQIAIRQFDAILNAGTDPHAYIQALYES